MIHLCFNNHCAQAVACNFLYRRITNKGPCENISLQFRRNSDVSVRYTLEIIVGEVATKWVQGELSSLIAPGRCSYIFKDVIFEQFVVSDIQSSFCEIALS